jgi:hypothetical protein
MKYPLSFDRDSIAMQARETKTVEQYSVNGGYIQLSDE